MLGMRESQVQRLRRCLAPAKSAQTFVRTILTWPWLRLLAPPAGSVTPALGKVMAPWGGDAFRDSSRGDGGSGLKEKPTPAGIVIGEAARGAPTGLPSRGEKGAPTCVQLKPPPP